MTKCPKVSKFWDRKAHGQIVNIALHVTLIGGFLTGQCNVNKKNNSCMAAYEINLKSELILKIERRK